MLTSKKEKMTPQMINHQRNITSAAYSYLNLHWITINSLSRSFKVTENTIAAWICEAIERKFVIKDTECMHIMEKHISEYETMHQLNNSSLRDMYHAALKKRSMNLEPANLDAVLGIMS